MVILLVRSTHIRLSSNACHYNSGGAALDSALSLDESYLFPCQDF
jgi:hypothetical protein